MAVITTPTVGRQVWFRPGAYEGMVRNDTDTPMAATVVYVWGDRMVNLVVLDHGGSSHMRTSVTLVQEGDEVPAGGGSYCEWMPYQKGQAAKAEQLEKQLGEHDASLKGGAA